MMPIGVLAVVELGHVSPAEVLAVGCCIINNDVPNNVLIAQMIDDFDCDFSSCY